VPNASVVDPTIEFKAVNGAISIDEAKGIVECFVAAVGNKDSVGDIVIPGAFDASLRRRKPRVVWGHDWNHPIGKVLEIYEVPATDPRLPMKMKQAGVGGLFARVQFNLKSEKGREAFSNVAFYGEEQEWSIGYKTLDSIYDNTRQANILKELELYEVSPVLHGANQLTGTISIKSESQEARIDSFRKSKWDTFDPEFAEMIKNEHPDIWRLGGNIRGNDQYRKLLPITKRGGSAQNETEIRALELREAWVARHFKNHQLPGVIAQIKWLAVGSRGQDYMKDLVREAIKAKKERKGLEIDPATFIAALQAMAEARDEGEDNDDDWEDFFDDDNDASGPLNLESIVQERRAQPGLAMSDPSKKCGCGCIKSESDDSLSVKAPAQVEALLDLPQERVTGDVMRGYGPRRGNLERLLRYWRPIMRKPGGFRRCLAILADHPELYPLERLCAWLHHETTGLWPNEGCHHPGMKNCRRKIQGVVRGSLWSDDEFNDRLRKRFGKKDDWDTDPSDSMEEPEFWNEYVTDDDIQYANYVLKQFVEEEKDFVSAMMNALSWVHEGENESGEWIVHDSMMKPKGCGCGCGGKSETFKGSSVKSGRVISSSNMGKLRQAVDLLNEVIVTGGESLQVKHVAALADDIKSFVQPVSEFYGVNLKVDNFRIEIPEIADPAAAKALNAALEVFEPQGEFLIIDTEPEMVWGIKNLIEHSFGDAQTYIDEEDGSWVAVNVKGFDVGSFLEDLANPEIKVKGISYGEMEVDCGCDDTEEK
jgi:HK97 family phage prohead protease